MPLDRGITQELLAVLLESQFKIPSTIVRLRTSEGSPLLVVALLLITELASISVTDAENAHSDWTAAGKLSDQ